MLSNWKWFFIHNNTWPKSIEAIMNLSPNYNSILLYLGKLSTSTYFRPFTPFYDTVFTVSHLQGNKCMYSYIVCDSIIQDTELEKRWHNYSLYFLVYLFIKIFRKSLAYFKYGFCRWGGAILYLQCEFS